MLNGILIKKAFNPAEIPVGHLLSRVLPTQSERYVAPMMIGTGIGLAGGAMQDNGNNKGLNMLLGGGLGALAGGTYGRFRQFRVGRPTFQIDPTGQSVKMHQTVAGGLWDDYGTKKRVANLTIRPHLIPPTPAQWQSALASGTAQG